MAFLTAIGLMSGTSMDGIDIAILRTDGVNAIEFGPSSAIATEAWAFLAVRSALGLPLTSPTTTGCSRPVTGGVRAEP